MIKQLLIATMLAVGLVGCKSASANQNCSATHTCMAHYKEVRKDVDFLGHQISVWQNQSDPQMCIVAFDEWYSYQSFTNMPCFEILQ